MITRIAPAWKIILPVTVLALAAVTVLSAAAAPDTWSRYVSADQRFSLHYPSGWEVTVTHSGIRIHQPASDEELTLLSLSNPDHRSAADMTGRVLALFRQTIPDLQSTGHRELQGNGLLTAFKGSRQGRDYQGLALVQLRAESGQWLSYTVPAGRYSQERALSLLRGVLSSLVTGPASPPPAVDIPPLPPSAPAERATTAAPEPADTATPETSLHPRPVAADDFIVGHWQNIHTTGYKEFTFFANGVFRAGGGATVTVNMVPQDTTLLATTQVEGEYGTFERQGHQLVLTWAEDGGRDSRTVGTLGADTRKRADDVLILNGANYERIGPAEGSAEIPRGLPALKVRVTTTDRTYSPPVFAVKPAILNTSSGLRIKLRSYGTHEFTIDLGPATWRMLFGARGQAIPLASLPVFSINAAQRCGVYRSGSLERRHHPPSGTITLVAVRPAPDGRRYLVSLRLSDVHLRRYTQEETYPEIIVNMELTDLNVG